MLEHERQIEETSPLSTSVQTAPGQDISQIVEQEESEEVLDAVFKRDLRIIQRTRAFWWCILTVYFVTVFPVLIYALMMHNRHDLVGYCDLISTLIFALHGAIALRQRSVVNRLAAQEAPKAVGPLLDMLAHNGLFLQGSIRTALIQLLPRLKASDAKGVNARQRKYLMRILTGDERWPYNGLLRGSDLKIAVLNSLKQIGDAKAIPIVERMSHSAKQGSVRLAAQDCLPYLCERIELMQVGQDLLRASSPSTPPAILLRPAMERAETPPQQLVRPVAGGSEDEA